MDGIFLIMQTLDGGQQTHIALGFLECSDRHQPYFPVIHQLWRGIICVSQYFLGLHCVVQHTAWFLEIQDAAKSSWTHCETHTVWSKRS